MRGSLSLGPSLGLALGLAGLGCSAAGTPVDAAMADVGADSGPCATDVDCPGSYCNPGSHACCVVTGFEICGDQLDQNCDRHDESCGDNDHDNVQACRAGDDPLGGCDCDDERADVRPAVGSVAGAPELCDGRDNDCNGRVDESSACCPACSALGTDGVSRGDACTAAGECDCSAVADIGPCAAGLHCCSAGCVDTQTDVANCGFCEAPCTAGADRCTAGACACGNGPPCDFTDVCTAGTCAPAM